MDSSFQPLVVEGMLGARAPRFALRMRRGLLEGSCVLASGLVGTFTRL